MTADRPFRHRAYGLSIDSSFALPGVPTAERTERDPDLTIGWSLPEAAAPETLTIMIPAAYAGAPAFGIRGDGAHALIWDGEIAILISSDIRAMQVYCRAEKLEFVPTLVVGIALGYVLHLRGVLCLHAAVFGDAEQAIAVMGNSGSGKSSLAAAMVRGGAKFYSDDLAAVTQTPDGGHRVFQGGLGLRVYPDSAAELLAGDEALEPVPYLNKSLWNLTGQRLPAAPPRLAALYWLEPSPAGTRPQVSPPMPLRDALRHVVRAWYPPYCRRLLSRQRLDQMRRLAEAVPLHIIRYEKSWDTLPPLLELLPR